MALAISASLASTASDSFSSTKLSKEPRASGFFCKGRCTVSTKESSRPALAKALVRACMGRAFTEPCSLRLGSSLMLSSKAFFSFSSATASASPSFCAAWTLCSGSCDAFKAAVFSRLVSCVLVLASLAVSSCASVSLTLASRAAFTVSALAMSSPALANSFFRPSCASASIFSTMENASPWKACLSSLATGKAFLAICETIWHTSALTPDFCAKSMAPTTHFTLDGVGSTTLAFLAGRPAMEAGRFSGAPAAFSSAVNQSWAASVQLNSERQSRRVQRSVSVTLPASRAASKMPLASSLETRPSPAPATALRQSSRISWSHFTPSTVS
mmetsp:Transcript_59253/g.141201  ORF Transcript_59253/g.141201 Transcript_59253/m.141201 type:complete len:329 (-) Transcript_59253:365-1351(-)